MGLDYKRRKLARTSHALMSAREYGKYLFLTNKEEIERLFLSYNMLVDESTLEELCGVMLSEIFKSTAQCIRHDVEVVFSPINNKKNSYFKITYERRNNKSRYV